MKTLKNVIEIITKNSANTFLKKARKSCFFSKKMIKNIYLIYKIIIVDNKLKSSF